MIFSWKLLLDKFPSRENFFKHKVDGLSYVLCGDRLKFSSHLFITCSLVSIMWYRIFKLLGLQVVLLVELKIIFESFISLGSKVKSMVGFDMVLHGVDHLIGA